MNLTLRELEHQRRGHWHFDPQKKTKDVFWSKRRLPREVCDRAVEMILPFARACYTDTADKTFVYSVPIYSASTRVYKPHLAYSQENNHPQIEPDAYETLDPFLNCNYELRRPWHTVTPTVKIPGVAEYLSEELEKFNYLNGEEYVDWRILVQWPGQMTPNHIDHVFKDYDKRIDRFERPDTMGNKYFTLLTPHRPGEYLQWGTEMISSWEPGDSFTWNWSLPHMTVNHSDQPRVSMMTLTARPCVPEDYSAEGLSCK